MKICAIICEYDPLHTGHVYLMREAKKQTSADAVVCIMSGNFVQRGESAILPKYIRAKHAVEAGADAVIELPVVFSTSNAELFAKGAVRIAEAIKADYLAFGAENADKDSFLSHAKLMNEEPKEISDEIKEKLKSGISYAKAKYETYAKILHGDFLKKPNNILGIEYTRAVLKSGCAIEIFPIERVGSLHGDNPKSQDEYASSSFIRSAVENGRQKEIEKFLPPFVLKDLKKAPDHLRALENFALLKTDKDQIRNTLDCSEGLENGLITAVSNHLDPVEKLTSKRYTSSRLQRILLQNLLGIREPFIRQTLVEPLYLNLLAVGENKNALLSKLGKLDFPLLVRPNDFTKLSGTAKELYNLTERADSIYALSRETYGDKRNPLH